MTSGITAEKVRDFCDVALAIYQYINKQKKKIKDNTDAIEQFICDMCFFAWGNYDQYRKAVGEYDHGCFDKVKLVLQSYFELSKELNDDFGQWSLGCIVTEQRALLLVRKRENSYFLSDPGMVQRYEEGHQVMIKKYRELLKELPLGDVRFKVGIYGTGRHTEGLLRAYNRLIGSIRAQICFFKTRITDNGRDEIDGYPVKSYLEIDDTYDLIIISSFIYQQEMKKNVLSINKDCKLLCFYNDTVRRNIFTGIDSLL